MSRSRYWQKLQTCQVLLMSTITYQTFQVQTSIVLTWKWVQVDLAVALVRDPKKALACCKFLLGFHCAIWKQHWRLAVSERLRASHYQEIYDNHRRFQWEDLLGAISYKHSNICPMTRRSCTEYSSCPRKKRRVRGPFSNFNVSTFLRYPLMKLRISILFLSHLMNFINLPSQWLRDLCQA